MAINRNSSLLYLRSSTISYYYSTIELHLVKRGSVTMILLWYAIGFVLLGSVIYLSIGNLLQKPK